MSDSSILFDADAFATEPPELLIGGRVFVGRLLSIVEWSKFQTRFVAITGEGEPDPAALAAMQGAFTEYLREVFPPFTESRRVARTDLVGRLLRRTRSVSMAIDPVAELEAAGPRALIQAFLHFFGHQCHALGLTRRPPTDPATSPSPAPGNTSSGKTVSAPGADTSN